MKQMNYIVKRAQQDPSNGASKVSFVASTATPDRYGDIIDQRGWDLENYKKNPVVLLNHDSSQLPIGRGVVNVKEGQLVIDVEFDDTHRCIVFIVHILNFNDNIFTVVRKLMLDVSKRALWVLIAF